MNELRGKMMKKSFALLLALLAIAGCVPESKDESYKIKDTIKRYNQLLSESCFRADMALMEQIVTFNHAGRLDHRLEALKMNKIRMATELKKIEIFEVKFLGKKGDADKVAAKTREIWNVRHVDIKTGDTVKEIKGLEYVMSYDLLRKDKEWLIDNANIIEEKVSQKK